MWRVIAQTTRILTVYSALPAANDCAVALQTCAARQLDGAFTLQARVAAGHFALQIEAHRRSVA